MKTRRKRIPIRTNKNYRRPKPAASSRKTATSGRAQSRFHDQAAASDETKTLGYPVAAVGASAGGLEAYNQLLHNLPDDLGVAFVFIQHLSPDHESLLPEILQRSTSMKVHTAASGMRVEPNNIYIMPPNVSMGIAGGLLRLLPRTEPAGQHMPIDFFFRSLAEDQGHNAVGIVLSGADSDGSAGLKTIKEHGGITITQDPKTAAVPSMPESAMKTANPVDFVLAPKNMAKELAKLAASPLMRAPENEPVGSKWTEQLSLVLNLISSRKSTDFSGYKTATLNRRIKRRMLLRRIDRLQDYLRLLKDEPAELDSLYNDLLINVTNFFRDSDAFETVRAKAFPQIAGKRPKDRPIRVWVPGCATGEEVYSLAILLLEYFAESGAQFPVQIFATDLSETALEHARSGLYTGAIRNDVSVERLRQYFDRVDDGFQIKRSIRDLCVFARHDLTRDPPFARMDLISCRNLLIYLGPKLQRRVTSVFGYSLNPEGFLFLGRAEALSANAEFFELNDKKSRLYRKKAVKGWIPLDLPASMPMIATPGKIRRGGTGDHLGDVQVEADRVILSRYSAVGVVVDESLQAIQFRGQTAPYIEIPPGEPNLNLLRIVKPELQLQLNEMISKARRTRKVVRKENILVPWAGRKFACNIEVVPVESPTGQKGFIVLFDRLNIEQGVGGRESGKTVRPVKESAVVAKLRTELIATREYLQANIHDIEAANEELQSANEEILSSNEELQSTNEELGTAKEELQSLNEELITVNEELTKRNAQLSELNDDMNNLLNSVHLPIIIVSSDLRVRRFTPTSNKVFHLVGTDVGRPISNIKANFNLPELERVILDTIDTMVTKEIEVNATDGTIYSLRVRPYRTVENKIDGAVLIFVDKD